MAKYTREEVFPKDRKKMRHFAFIHFISQKGRLETVPEWQDLPQRKEFEVTITIQGVEVDYLNFMDRLEKHFEEREEKIEEREEKIEEREEKIEEREEKIEERAKEMMKKRFRCSIDALENLMDASKQDDKEWIRENFNKEIKEL